MRRHPCPLTTKEAHLTPEPRPQRDVDLVLHIGSGKTGTTSIQNFLHLNRERLAELGHLYPKSPGAKRHLRLGLFVKPDSELDGTIVWSRQRFSDPTAFRRSFRRKLFAEINDSGLSHVIMSDEALYGSSNEAIRGLRTFTDQNAKRLRLVLYLRRQDDHLSSRYQQVVKTGEVRRLAERTQRLDLSSTYDYHARLSTWRRLSSRPSSSYAASSATASWTDRCSRTSSTPPVSTSGRTTSSRSSRATRAWTPRLWSSCAS